MDIEARALYQQRAQLRKEKEDLDTEMELLFAILASAENEVPAKAEGSNK